MRVLLTGHQGYLGALVAPMLISAGHDVTGLDVGLFADCVLGPPPRDPDGYRVDVRDVSAAELHGVDAIVHLAALSNDPLGFLAPELTYEINHRASVRLATLARDCGVRRFVYASTCSVYGAGGDQLVTEDAPLRPLTPYAVSKIRVEDDLAELADDDFCPVFLRNATAFGFSPRLRTDVVVNNLVAGAVLTGDVHVRSDGRAWRPLVHVRDIAAAVVAAIAAPPAAVCGRAFNVGSEENNLTVAQIAELVVAAIPDATLTIGGETGRDNRSYRVDFSRIRTGLPGFSARHTVAAGISELCERFRQHGLTPDGFEHRFNRMAWLSGRRRDGHLDDQFRVAA